MQTQAKDPLDKKHHQFYLVDTDGREHLAAIAEDHGDAHYAYQSIEAFRDKHGELSGHSRKDLIMWCGHRRDPFSPDLLYTFLVTRLIKRWCIYCGSFGHASLTLRMQTPSV